jgi:regulatory protein
MPARGATGKTSRLPASAKALAVRMLARRDYSRAELEQRLLHKGIPRDDIERALDELTAQGLLSDSRFAGATVRRKSGAYSKRAIAGALKASGVEGDVASQALAASEVDDADAIVALWLRRFGAPPANDREKARQIRFLQSRGFSLSAIFKLLREPPPV